MCCVVEGCGPGVTLVDAADALADIGVERVAHACQADGCRHIGAGLSLLRAGVTIGDFSGAGTASTGNLAEVTWGRLYWSGLVAGRGSVAGRGWWALKSRQS